MSKLLTLLNNGFSPTSIANLGLWLDASDLATLNKDGSEVVTDWNDKSGNGNDAAQSNASNKPTWQATGLNSRPTLHFINDYLEISDATTLNYSDISLFVVTAATVDSNGLHYIIWKWLNSGQLEFTLQHDFANDDIRFNSSSNGTSVNGSITGGALNLGTAQIVEVHNDNGAATGSELVIGGGSVGTDSTPGTIHNGTDPLRIGHGSTGGEKTISEVLLYTQTLSAAQRTQIRRYLTAKWGI